MAERRPLVVIDEQIVVLPIGDTLPSSGSDYLSSYDEVQLSETITVPIRQQMIVFGELIVDGTINLLGTVVVLGA
jgi:hypothetical protein